MPLFLEENFKNLTERQISEYDGFLNCTDVRLQAVQDVKYILRTWNGQITKALKQKFVS